MVFKKLFMRFWVIILIIVAKMAIKTDILSIEHIHKHKHTQLRIQHDQHVCSQLRSGLAWKHLILIKTRKNTRTHRTVIKTNMNMPNYNRSNTPKKLEGRTTQTHPRAWRAEQHNHTQEAGGQNSTTWQIFRIAEQLEHVQKAGKQNTREAGGRNSMT